MGLSSIFRTKGASFQAAIENNDLDAMRVMMTRKSSSYGWAFFYDRTYISMSPQMMELLAGAGPDVWQRWSPFFGSGDKLHLQRVILQMILEKCLKTGRYDLADALLDQKPDFNSGTAQDHSVSRLIDAEMPATDKVARIRKAMFGGYEKIEGGEYFLQRCAEKGFVEGIGLFAALGFDVHRNNEQLLRGAVHNRQEAVCRYLVDIQKADAGLALRTMAEAGMTEDFLYLQSLAPKDEAEKKPVTLESLSAEVGELKATVKMLTEMLTEMRNPEKRFDKPGLTLPRF